MNVYPFIEAEKVGRRNVKRACELLEVSRAAFYEWLKCIPSKRCRADRMLLDKIRSVHEDSKGTYGSPRVHAQLRNNGEVCGKNRIARLMQLNGIVGKAPRRFKRTTIPGTAAAAVDLVKRVFGPGTVEVDRLWCGDISYIRTWEGWLYLATVIDVASRRVVGWAMADHMRSELVTDALKMALGQRRPGPGLIFHSDRGCQYVSGEFTALLDRNKIVQSLSRPGQCWDNAVAESFFATLKTELIHRHAWPTRAYARRAIFEFIEGWVQPASSAFLARLHVTGGLRKELRDPGRHHRGSGIVNVSVDSGELQMVETIAGQDCSVAVPDCAVQLQGAVVKAANESVADLYTNACPPDAEVDECAARYASTVADVLADMDASLQDPCSLTGTCGVQLLLTSPAGGALSNASYRMYLRPDVLAPDYVPPLLSAGRTDISSRIQLNISTAMRALPAAQLPDPGETMNVVLLAVDDSHRWMVDWNIVLPTSGAYSEAIVANTDMAAELPDERTSLKTKDILGVASFSMDVVPASDPEEPDPLLSEVDNSNEVPGEDVEPTTSPHAAYEASLQAWANAEGDDEDKCPEPEPSEMCKIKTRPRWVKIAALHADKGLLGKFGCGNGKETSTQIAGKFEGSNWKVTGWVREHVSRDAYGARQKEKEFHRVMLAQYMYHLWKRTPCCDPGMKNSKQWYMGYWTGDLAKSTYEPPVEPHDPKWDIKMEWPDSVFSTSTQKNEEFGFGVGLSGLELNSQTGYSSITDLTWFSNGPNCDWKRLWGKGVSPTNADIIYADTRECA